MFFADSKLNGRRLFEILAGITVVLQELFPRL